MSDEVSKEGLYIPRGIKAQREYFYGYGKNELVITIISSFIAVGIGILIYLIKQNILAAVFEVLALPTATVIIVVKNDCNISVADQVKFMLDFARDQKQYYYVYQDEWK